MSNLEQPPTEMPLGTALEALRAELEAAWERGKEQSVRFRVSEVSLTLETVVRTSKDAKGGIRWYVVQVGGGTSNEHESTQTVVLRLEPGIYDERGYAGPVEAGADHWKPGN